MRLFTEYPVLAKTIKLYTVKDVPMSEKLLGIWRSGLVNTPRWFSVRAMRPDKGLDEHITSVNRWNVPETFRRRRHCGFLPRRSESKTSSRSCNDQEEGSYTQQKTRVDERARKRKNRSVKRVLKSNNTSFNIKVAIRNEKVSPILHIYSITLSSIDILLSYVLEPTHPPL